MAEREYFLGPILGTKREDVVTVVGIGHLTSLLDDRVLQILDLPANTDSELIIKIKVIDNP